MLIFFGEHPPTPLKILNSPPQNQVKNNHSYCLCLAAKYVSGMHIQIILYCVSIAYNYWYYPIQQPFVEESDHSVLCSPTLAGNVVQFSIRMSVLNMPQYVCISTPITYCNICGGRLEAPSLTYKSPVERTYN